MTDSDNTQNPLAQALKADTEPTPTPKPKNSVSPKAEPATPYAVVGGGDTDTVKLSAIKYKNIHARKSLSVHHVQRRLNELGYSEAYADQDGFYGDLTKEAFIRWQEDNNYTDVTEVPTEASLKALFKGDPNVSFDLS